MARKDTQSTTAPVEEPKESPLHTAAKPVELMDEMELVKLHGKLCSQEPPECKRTFHQRDFRAHVLLLVSEKQKRIA